MSLISPWALIVPVPVSWASDARKRTNVLRLLEPSPPASKRTKGHIGGGKGLVRSLVLPSALRRHKTDLASQHVAQWMQKRWRSKWCVRPPALALTGEVLI